MKKNIIIIAMIMVLLVFGVSMVSCSKAMHQTTNQLDGKR